METIGMIQLWELGLGGFLGDSDPLSKARHKSGSEGSPLRGLPNTT